MMGWHEIAVIVWVVLLGGLFAYVVGNAFYQFHLTEKQFEENRKRRLEILDERREFWKKNEKAG